MTGRSGEDARARTDDGPVTAANMPAVPRIAVSAYTVSRLPDTTADHSIWSVRIEAAGHGRWAIRHLGEYEPIPSSRTDGWLATVRWDDIVPAMAAAVEAEKRLVVNGLTSAEVLARMEAADG